MTAKKKTSILPENLFLHLKKSSIGFTSPEYFTLEDLSIESQDGEKREFTARTNSSSHTPSLDELPVLNITPFPISYML